MRAAFGFLTVLPARGEPSAASMLSFPLVGCVVGLVVGGVWLAASSWWGAWVAACLALAADLALTGLLHVDGLADSADGLLAPMDRERRLEVMRLPDVGAFAVAAVAAVLLTRTAALAEQQPSVGLVVALWCASRTAMALAPSLLPYARREGLASRFLGAGRWPAYGFALAAGIAWSTVGARGLASVAAAAAGCAVVALLGFRRLGGFTGDVLGAMGIVGETVGLVVAAGRW